MNKDLEKALAAEDLAQFNKVLAELDRLRREIRHFRAEVRRAIDENPGKLVVYEPLGLGEALDAIVECTDTQAQREQAMASGDRMFEVMRSPSYQVCILSPTVERPKEVPSDG